MLVLTLVMVVAMFSTACGILSAFFKLVAAETACHAVCVDLAFRWVSIVLYLYFTVRSGPQPLYRLQSSNVDGQSPCQVANVLDGQYSISMKRRLSEALVYSGISPQYATPYVCNEFYHTLLAVCALCQGESASKYAFKHRLSLT
jgi:hypothetical protein